MENHLNFTAFSPSFLAMKIGQRICGMMKKARIPVRLKKKWQRDSLKAFTSILNERAAMREVAVVPRFAPRVMG